MYCIITITLYISYTSRKRFFDRRDRPPVFIQYKPIRQRLREHTYLPMCSIANRCCRRCLTNRGGRRFLLSLLYQPRSISSLPVFSIVARRSTTNPRPYLSETSSSPAGPRHPVPAPVAAYAPGALADVPVALEAPRVLAFDSHYNNRSQ